MADLQQVEKLLCERYNVRALDGPLKDAIDAGDVATLRALIAERGMYRWHAEIMAALEAPSETPISRMVKRDLVATAIEQEVEVPAEATVADLREALTEPAEEPVNEEPIKEEDNRSSRSRPKTR